MALRIDDSHLATAVLEAHGGRDGVVPSSHAIWTRRAMPLKSTDVAQYATRGGMLWEAPAYYPSDKTDVDDDGVDGNHRLFPNWSSRHVEEVV